MTKQYVVAQTPPNGAWVHYLCGWCGSGDDTPSGWHASRSDDHGVPVFLHDRGQALTFDAATAARVVEQLNLRYRNVVRNYVEELSV